MHLSRLENLNAKLKMILNRYTSLPILLDMLVRKSLILLNPTSWEDRNDSFYVEKYRETKGLKSVLALCFTTRRETFHHWKVFSNGSSGVCIEFNKVKLLGFVRQVPGVRWRTVKYKLIKELRQHPPGVEDWPFLKRRPFRDEGELRIIYETSELCEETKEIPFDLRCIRKITLSPWLPASLRETVAIIINQIDGCESLEVNRSTLIENFSWRARVIKASVVPDVIASGRTIV